MRRSIIAGAALLALAGCSDYLSGADALRQNATKAVQQQSDIEAETISALRCRPTLGASARTMAVPDVLNELEHCGLPKAVIFQELRRQGYGSTIF